SYGAALTTQVDSGHGFYTTTSGTGAGNPITWAPQLNLHKSNGAVFNEDGIDLDFRVESDTNTHALFVDASANKVAIGSTQTNGLLTVIGSGSGTYNTLTLSSNAAGNTVKTGGITYLNYAGNSASVYQSYTSSTASSLYFGSADTSHRGPTAVYFMAADGLDTTASHRKVLAYTKSVFVVNDDSNDTDFRVESDNLYSMFFVDTSTDRVHVGNTEGDYVLNVNAQTAGSSSGTLFVGAALNGSGKGVLIDASTRTSAEDSVRLLQVRDRQAYNALTVNVGGTVEINDDGGSWGDFRVESDSNANMLFVDAGNDRISIGSSSSLDAQLTVQNAQNNGTIGHLAGNTISNNGVRPACIEMIHAVDTVSSGTVLTIPITEQGGLWNQYQVELMVVTGEYNINTTARGGSAKFSFTSLNVVRGFVQQEVTGNISSISVTENDTNACNIRVNFSNAYTSGSTSRNGVQVYAKVLSDRAQFFELDNATLN
ncbi:hypothetical protein OAM26_04105, partial [Porticoccaceae bacterium]|nr:hypothetical protein [Porticoccaceae bacterium]